MGVGGAASCFEDTPRDDVPHLRPAVPAPPSLLPEWSTWGPCSRSYLSPLDRGSPTPRSASNFSAAHFPPDAHPKASPLAL